MKIVIPGVLLAAGLLAAGSSVALLEELDMVQSAVQDSASALLGTAGQVIGTERELAGGEVDFLQAWGGSAGVPACTGASDPLDLAAQCQADAAALLNGLVPL